jgi:hypothetical protein
MTTTPPLEVLGKIIQEADDLINDRRETNTETLSSWIIQYRKENGRTYHAFEQDKYWCVGTLGFALAS